MLKEIGIRLLIVLGFLAIAFIRAIKDVVKRS